MRWYEQGQCGVFNFNGTTTKLQYNDKCYNGDDDDVAPTTVCFYLKKNIYYFMIYTLRSQQKRLNLC